MLVEEDFCSGFPGLWGGSVSDSSALLSARRLALLALASSVSLSSELSVERYCSSSYGCCQIDLGGLALVSTKN